MKDHDAVRELLPLAAAGVLNVQEQRLVDSHVAGCASCTAEAELWRLICGGIGHLPLPSPAPGLVARTSRRIVQEAGAGEERRWSDAVLAVLVLFGWTVLFVLWLLGGLMTGGRLAIVKLSIGNAIVWLGASTLLAWLTAGAAVVVLALRPRSARRYL